MTFKLDNRGNTPSCVTLEARGSEADHTMRKGLLTMRLVDGLVVVTDPSQAWFWTREWQAGEREADEDIRRGRTTFYGSEDEFLTSLSGRRQWRADVREDDALRQRLG